MTKLKALKRNIIMCAVYLLLLAVLITGVTTAKYTESVTIYSSYGAASFNTVILGTDFDDNGERVVKALNETIDPAQGNCFLPGMKYDSNVSDNTAKLYPFSISNGVTEENVSGIGMIFTLNLRTAGNLPLVFSIKHGDRMLYTGQPQTVSVSDSAEDPEWVEYAFYESPEAMENGEQASFTLGGGTLDYEDFTLIVEWPITSDENGNSNSEKYMKEVDLFELQVSTSSVDMSNIKSDPAGYTIPAEELYGAGLIILPAYNDETQEEIHYEIDYRSLREMTVETGSDCSMTVLNNAFPITVDNGNRIHPDEAPVTQYTDTSFSLIVPVNAATEPLAYTLLYKDSFDINGNGETEDYIPLTIESTTLFYKDPATGSVLDATAIGEAENAASFRSYYKYTFTLGTDSSGTLLTFPNQGTDHAFRLRNAVYDAAEEQYVPVDEACEFLLSVSGIPEDFAGNSAEFFQINHVDFVLDTNETHFAH